VSDMDYLELHGVFFTLPFDIHDDGHKAYSCINFGLAGELV